MSEKNEKERNIPIISVVGKSGSGKTTFLEKLIARLKEKGYSVGTVKHDVHGFDIDKPGKDTWRHKQAGADMVLISSPEKLALIKDVNRDHRLDELRQHYIDDVDIVLTEGYKSGDKPKIEVFRPEIHDSELCDEGDDLVTTVINEENEGNEEDIFSPEEIDRVASLLEKKYISSS